MTTRKLEFYIFGSQYFSLDTFDQGARVLCFVFEKRSHSEAQGYLEQPATTPTQLTVCWAHRRADTSPNTWRAQFHLDGAMLLFPRRLSAPLGWAALEWCLFLVDSVGFPAEDSHFPAHQRLYQGCVHLHPTLLLTSLSWFLFLQVPSLPWSPFCFYRVLGLRSKRAACSMCLSACDVYFS